MSKFSQPPDYEYSLRVNSSDTTTTLASLRLNGIGIAKVCDSEITHLLSSAVLALVLWPLSYLGRSAPLPVHVISSTVGKTSDMTSVDDDI